MCLSQLHFGKVLNNCQSLPGFFHLVEELETGVSYIQKYNMHDWFSLSQHVGCLYLHFYGLLYACVLENVCGIHNNHVATWLTLNKCLVCCHTCSLCPNETSTALFTTISHCISCPISFSVTAVSTTHRAPDKVPLTPDTVSEIHTHTRLL